MPDWPSVCSDDANLLWVDMEAPSEENLTKVAELFKIDPRAVYTIQRSDRRPTVRTYRDHHLVTGVALNVDTTEKEPRLTTIPLDLLVGRNFLISLHQGPLPFAEELEERTATNPRLGRLDSSYLLYMLLDTLVSHYAREFDEVEDEVERLEEQLLSDPGRDALDQVVVMKHYIHELRRLISPHRQAFGVLVAADHQIPEQNVEGYFRDLLVHLGSLIERMDHVRDILTGSYSLYISNISHRTNQQLRVLTFLSAVLLPMTLITGIFGTNFTLAEYQYWEPFYVMLAGMGLIAMGLLMFFRLRRWL